MKYGKYKGSSHHRILTKTLTAINFKGRQRGETESGLGELVSFQPACLKVADSEVSDSDPGVETFFSRWFALIGKLRQYGDFKKSKQKKKIGHDTQEHDFWQRFC